MPSARTHDAITRTNSAIWRIPKIQPTTSRMIPRDPRLAANAPGPDGLPLTADDIPIHGVAPQAKLMSYKVCSDIGSTLYSAAGVAVPFIGGCDTSNIVMAIEDATKSFTVTGFAKPKADVINMSLGGGGGPDEPTAVASDNAVLDGVTVVAAAGNSGPGEATLGSPAAGTASGSPTRSGTGNRTRSRRSAPSWWSSPTRPARCTCSTGTAGTWAAT